MDGGLGEPLPAPWARGCGSKSRAAWHGVTAMPTRRAHTRTTASGRSVRVGEAVIRGGRGPSSIGSRQPIDEDRLEGLRGQAARQAADAGSEAEAAAFYQAEAFADGDYVSEDGDGDGGANDDGFAFDIGGGGGEGGGGRKPAGGYGMRTSGFQYAMQSKMRAGNRGGGGGRGGGRGGDFGIKPEATMIGKLLAAFGRGGGGG